MSSKELAISFLKMVVDHKIRDAYDKFIAPDFIHHNQYFMGDRQTLMLAMEEADKKNPNKSFEVKHAYEAGDTAIIHSKVVQKAGDNEIAVIHILRFKNGKCVEMWDVGQVLDPKSPNENGPF
ncbi:MAG: ester cyclase [Bdellovibrionia bacterium]